MEQGDAAGFSEFTEGRRVIFGNPGYVNSQVNVCCWQELAMPRNLVSNLWENGKVAAQA